VLNSAAHHLVFSCTLLVDDGHLATEAADWCCCLLSIGITNMHA
jgi:hypothetical protein